MNPSPSHFNFNESWQRLLYINKAIAIIRSPQINLGLAMARAVAAGGIKLIEITWNSDRPEELISKLRRQFPDCTIGAGTILNSSQLETAISAGAQFIFSPHLDCNLLETALHRYNVPLVPGVFSPTEIVRAWQAGANIVKLFPIQALGGANYIKSLQGPLSQVGMIPTGGVTIDNSRAMLDAGAVAVGLAGNLFPAAAVTTQNWSEITKRTQLLLTKLN